MGGYFAMKAGYTCSRCTPVNVAAGGLVDLALKVLAQASPGAKESLQATCKSSMAPAPP